MVEKGGHMEEEEGGGKLYGGEKERTKQLLNRYQTGSRPLFGCGKNKGDLP